MNKLFRFFSILAFATLFMSFNVEAQNASKLQDIKVEDSFNVEVNFKEINKQLNKYQEKLKGLNKVSSEETTEVTQFINTTRSQLIDAKKVFEKELKFVQKRIDALGEGPKEGEKEVGVIAQKRKEFNNELNYQKGQIAEADVLLTRLDESDNLILNIRSKALLGNLLDRQEPLIYPTVFYHSTGLFVEFFYDIVHSPLDWYENLNDVEKVYVKSNTLSTLFVIFLSLWIGVYLRLFIMRKFGYKKEFEHPRYGRKVMAAIFVAIAYGVIPASIIAGFLIWIVSTKILAVGFFGVIVKSFLYYSLYVVLARAVSRVLFAPYNEKWRIVNVSTEKAKRVTSALYLAALIIGISAFFEHVADNANYPILLSSYLTSMACAVKAFCIVLIVKRLLWDGIDDENEDDIEDDAETEIEDNSVNVAFRITFFTSVFALSVFIISLSGYPFLSSFILNRFILSFLLIGLLIIIRKAFEEILHRLLLLRFWVKTFKLRRKIISKINFWLSLVVDPLFVLAGLFLVLALWGVSTDLLKQFISKMFFGFTVGGIKISLISIVFGILIFFIGVSFIKALKKRLMNNVLSKMDIDDGIKHSLEAGFGSLGFVISALLAIAVMGGDLTNFALIAGALSFGVGLGLQNVVNNFVSGIILLFERPIKVGDWVIVNGQEGVVKQINIRATELETWKKASIIIPNADLLSTTVTNLTHNDSWGRLDIGIGVAYGSDTRKVAEVLLEVAEGQKKVLKKPAPYVIFKNFGESSLDFELRCFTADIMGGLGVSSEVRFEIDRRFREENIEIPFPQRVLHFNEEITRNSLNHMLEGVNKKDKK